MQIWFVKLGVIVLLLGALLSMETARPRVPVIPPVAFA